MPIDEIDESKLRILEESPGIYVNTFLYHFSDVAKVVLCEQMVKDGRIVPRACVLLTEQNARFVISALTEWLQKKAEFTAQMGAMAGGAPEGGKLN